MEFYHFSAFAKKTLQPDRAVVLDNTSTRIEFLSRGAVYTYKARYMFRGGYRTWIFGLLLFSGLESYTSIRVVGPQQTKNQQQTKISNACLCTSRIDILNIIHFDPSVRARCSCACSFTLRSYLSNRIAACVTRLNWISI